MANTIELWANNARTTMAGSLSNVATSIVLQSGAGALFPSPNNTIGQFAKATIQDAATALRNEIVYITARTGDVLTVVRGQDSTTAQTWSAGDTVFEGVTAATLGGFVQPAQLQNNSYNHAIAGGTANAITATYTPAYAFWVDGMTFFVKITADNTITTPTVSPNGLTAKTIVKVPTGGVGVPLALKDLTTGMIAEFKYSQTLDQVICQNPATSGGLVGVQIFSTVGTTTYTPTAGTNFVIVEVVGGGAGGGGVASSPTTYQSCSGGGGGGAYAKVKITSAFSGVTVTVGGAGAGGVSYADGGTGGTSSFGALVSCAGGSGTGNKGQSYLNYVGNTSSGGGGGSLPAITGTTIVACKGVTGAGGYTFNTNGSQTGVGGGSPLGSPGWSFSGSFAGNAATGYGAGGSGAASLGDNVAKNGGAGSQGVVIVWEYR